MKTLPLYKVLVCTTDVRAPTMYYVLANTLSELASFIREECLFGKAKGFDAVESIHISKVRYSVLCPELGVFDVREKREENQS